MAEFILYLEDLVDQAVRLLLVVNLDVLFYEFYALHVGLSLQFLDELVVHLLVLL